MSKLTMVEPCKSCEHKARFKGFWVCGCQCKRATLNGGHPLSPCCVDNGDCIRGADEWGDYDCFTDELAIMEGNRCISYINWLEAMRAFNGKGYRYPTGFKNPILTDEETDRT